MRNEKDPDKLWYKNALFYAVIVEVFADGNGDGIGDFKGLTEKLDYLEELGVDCIWLLPFYPTSHRDNGYDVTDYYDIDQRFGTIQDFRKFVREAKKRKIKVIIDLVVHHTSNEHPWFVSSREGHPLYKDYYVWTKEIPDGEQAPSAFPGVEAGVWQYDTEAKAYYYHSFYRSQPDLNLANPQVQKEIEKIMDFWMAQGIDGFRMDAVTLMFEKKGIENTAIENPIPIMEDWNNLVTSWNPSAIILGEADITIDKIQTFFGTGGRMDLMYNFLLNRYIFLSLARVDATPMKDFLKRLPVPPFAAQWLNFLRNHDELNIETLTHEEQKNVYDAFAPDMGMRIYERGIRRRMAPMLEGNLRHLKMAYSLLFALPGAVMMLYGDEIGMGDDLRLPERVSVRTPMQWDSTENAGFSNSHPSTLVRSVIAEGPFRYQKVNVAEEDKDEGSLLHHIKHLNTVRKAHPQLGHGAYKLLNVNPDEVFAISYDWEGKTVIILHNLSEHPCKASLEEFKHATLEQFYAGGVYRTEESAKDISLHGFGYRWFYVKTQ